MSENSRKNGNFDYFVNIFKNKKVFISGALEPRNTTLLITENDQCCVSYMINNHMEADTRMIFHVDQIQIRYQVESLNIVIESPDTDVFLLLLYHYHEFENKPKIWFHTGNITRKLDHRRYIPIDVLAAEVGDLHCKCVLILHALTGCDTVSAFFGIGKKTAYSGMCNLSDVELQELSNFHNLDNQNALNVATILLRKIYDPKSKCKITEPCINKFRYYLATKKTISIDRLPPSKPSLLQHILRANWQINEWIQARQANINEKDADKNGWIVENDELMINYFEGETAMEFLQKYFCNCSGKNPCKSENCACFALSLQCCDICDCSEKCNNRASDEAPDDGENTFNIEN